MTFGIACGCAIGLNPGPILGKVLTSDINAVCDSRETSCGAKMEFTQRWVKRFFDIVDHQLGEETRNNLIISNRTACAKGAYGELTDDKPATIDEIYRKLAEWQKTLGKENIYRIDNIIFFIYVGNPDGLKISDGYCLCPMIENKPEILSATFCQCSVDYVKYLFQKNITFRPVQVELLDPLRSGGRSCRFKVTL